MAHVCDLSRLFQPTCFHHVQRPLIDAVVQEPTRRAQTDGEGVPRPSCRTRPSTRIALPPSGVLFSQSGIGLARDATDFQRANHPVGVGGVYGFAVLWVQLLELLQEGEQALRGVLCIEGSPHSWICRYVVEPFLYRLGIQSTATHHDGHLWEALGSARFEVTFQPGHGFGGKPPCAVFLVERQKVYKVVWCFCTLVSRRLGCANGNAAIKLPAIG